MKTTDRILVIDLEATCWEGRQPKDQVSEIIEIGICVLDTQDGSISKNKGILIKPEKSSVSPFCTQLTIKKNYVICDFNESQIKAFQLLRVMTHEIGHHVDRIGTRSRKKCPRGEIFAFKFEKEYERILWNKYFEYFSL